MFEAEPVITKTTCPYCGVGCGVRAELTSGRRLTVRAELANRWPG